ncbi:unnamed protein product, partial [Urochloa humidicola]
DEFTRVAGGGRWRRRASAPERERGTAAAGQAGARRGRPTAGNAEAGGWSRPCALRRRGAVGAGGVQLVGRRRAAGGGDAEAAEELQGRQAGGAGANGEGEPGAGAAGTRAARLARARPGRAGRPGQEVELPAGAQPAAQRVVAVPCRLAAATAVV